MEIKCISHDIFGMKSLIFLFKSPIDDRLRLVLQFWQYIFVENVHKRQIDGETYCEILLTLQLVLQLLQLAAGLLPLPGRGPTVCQSLSTRAKNICLKPDTMNKILHSNLSTTH